MTYLCPTCGFPFKTPIEDSDICPSCGTQFGYSDSGRTYAQLRENWIQRGALWHSRVEHMPPEWNPWLQLIQAGHKYSLPFRVQVRISGIASPVRIEPPFRVQKELNEITRVVYV